MPSTIRQLRVFLCHASQDKSIVLELQQRLEDEGWIDPWLDEKKLHPGEDWRVSIEEAVESSDLVVICLSNNSVDKEGFVQKELRYAREIALEKPEGTIFLIPLRLEDCDTPRGLRFFQWTDYFGEKKEQNYNTLLESFSIRRKQVVHREEEKARQEAVEKEKREKEEKARKEAEESAKREAEELARRKALEIVLKEEEERAHILALEKTKKEAFEKALEDAREKARLEAELYAQKEVNENKHKGGMTNFIPSSFSVVVSLLFIGLVFGIGLVGFGQIGMGAFAKEATKTIEVTTTLPVATEIIEIAATIPPVATEKSVPITATKYQSNSSILLDENFEDGKAQSISSASSGWKIISDETGNKVCAIDNSKSAGYPRIYLASSEKWKDYEIKYRVRFVGDTSIDTIIEFRCQDETCRDKYVVFIDSSSINLGYTVNSYNWDVLKNKTYPIKRNTWYWIRIQAQGQDLRVYIDDVQVISTVDSRYTGGEVNIQAGPYTYIQIDDIQVTSLEK